MDLVLVAAVLDLVPEEPAAVVVVVPPLRRY